MFYLIAFLLFVIVFKNERMKTLAFSVEKEYYCYLEKEKKYEETENFLWQCFRL